MSGRSRGTRLPPAVLEVIDEVLDAAGLDFVDGRAEVEEELRAHFEDGLAAGTTVETLVERFGDPVEAGRRIARTRPRAAARERGEAGRWWMSIHAWWMETRRAARRLGRAPGFAAVVVLTLALGVGANTAVFTVLSAALPYEDADRLVRVYESEVEDPTARQFIRAPVLAEWRTWDEVFQRVGGIYTYRETGADLTDGEQPRRVVVARVSAGYFETLGARPILGRTFREEESFGPGESVRTTSPIVRHAILSHGLWAGHFGADPGIVGRSVLIDGASWEVVGVMPPGFSDPIGSQADVWVPQDLRPGGSNSYGNFYMSAVARLRDGLTVEAAQERLRTLAVAYGERQPDVAGSFPLVVPLRDDVVGSKRQTMLWLLAAAAGLVLLTACVNVANLLFARGLARDRDLALRSALGSGRARLIAAILTENGLLAVAGGVAGLLLGWLGVRALVSVAPDVVPLAGEIGLSASVFGFAFLVTSLALLGFGLTPALRMSRARPAEVLRSGDRSATVGRVVRRLRDGLVVVQVGAALALVAGSLLLTRSFASLLDVPLGVEEEGVLTFEVHLPGGRYPEGVQRHAFHERFQARVARLQGVRAVGAVSWLPVNGRYHIWGFEWVSGPQDVQDDWYGTEVRIFAGDYFDVLGIEVLSGRAPADVDLEAEPVIWINRIVADDVFGDVDPLGQVIDAAGAERRIAGVVEAIPYDARGESSRKVYVPHAQYADNRNWSLVQLVRAEGDLLALRDRVRDELARVDPDLVLHRPRTFADHLGAVRAQDRFAALLMGAFAALALVLSIVGTYGVLAGTVAGRTREIGIRMALGADPWRVRRIVLRYGAALIVPGVFLGVSAVWIASRWIESLLFEVDAGDPVAYVGAASIFLVVGLVSAWLPAEHAARVDTMETLTAE